MPYRGDRKPDADEIVAFMRGLPEKLGLGNDGRESWPRFLFHSTDLENAVSILRDEALLCRSQAKAQHRLAVDSAHREIIQRTEAHARDCVRLYFRPRTPTNFGTEGFRSFHDPEVEPQGVTVMFVLDANVVMTLAKTEFTNGNAARSTVTRGNDAAFLRTIPFEHVYHEGMLPDRLKDEIVFHRNAEVLIPGRLALDGVLRSVMVRSEAELQTLLSRLRDMGDVPYRTFQPFCRVNRKTDLFFRYWTYIERVSVADGAVAFQFSPDTRTPDGFDLRLRVISNATGRVLSDFSQDVGQLNRTIRARLPEECVSGAFTIELYLNDRMAFRNSYDPADTVIW